MRVIICCKPESGEYLLKKSLLEDGIEEVEIFYGHPPLAENHPDWAVSVRRSIPELLRYTRGAEHTRALIPVRNEAKRRQAQLDDKSYDWLSSKNGYHLGECIRWLQRTGVPFMMVPYNSILSGQTHEAWEFCCGPDPYGKNDPEPHDSIKKIYPEHYENHPGRVEPNAGSTIMEQMMGEGTKGIAMVPNELDPSQW